MEIPWNDVVDQRFSTRIAANQQTFAAQMATLTRLAPSVALNMSADLQRQYDQAKATGDVALNAIRDTNKEIGGLIDRTSNLVSTLEAEIASQKAKNADLHKDVKQREQLQSLRSEQVAALKAKYDANYHSSWMGLWRPLSDASRTALFVAAVAFGIIAAVSIAYLTYGALPTLRTRIGAMIGAAAPGGGVPTSAANIFANIGR
jgi:hypothetical protein